MLEQVGAAPGLRLLGDTLWGALAGSHAGLRKQRGERRWSAPGSPAPPAGEDAALLPRLGQEPLLRWRKLAAAAAAMPMVAGGGRRRLPKFCALGSLATPQIRFYLKGLPRHRPASIVTYMAIYGKQEALIWQDPPGGPGVT